MSIKSIVTEIDALSTTDLGTLITELEKRYRVSAKSVQVGVPVSTVPPPAKTEFDVVLLAPGEDRVKCIRVVREVLGHTLTDSRNLVDAVPAIIKLGVSKDVAETLKAKFVDVGATVEIR